MILKVIDLAVISQVGHKTWLRVEWGLRGAAAESAWLGFLAAELGLEME
jgi:hypothetical protein